MTTFVPPRYPDWHAKAGRIIATAEEVAELEALKQIDDLPAPKLTPPAGSRYAAQAEADPPAAPAAAPADLSDRIAAPIAPDQRRPLSELAGERLAGSGRETGKPAAGDRERGNAVAGAVILAIVALVVYVAARQAPLAEQPAALPTAAVPTSAAPTAGPAATNAPTSTALPPNMAPRALIAYFDYTDATSATPLERGTAYEPIGRAGDRWLLVRAGDAQVWALAEDLGVVVDPALPDLAPRQPAYVPPAAPAYVPPSAPAACVQVTIGIDVSDARGPIGHVEGVGCTVAEAQANAEQLAAELRASRAPTPAPTREVRQ